MRAPGKEREEQQDSSRLVFLSGLGGTNHEHERRDRVGNPPTSLRRYDVRNSRRVSMRYHAHALRSTRTDPDDDGTTPLQTLPTPKGGSSAPLPARKGTTRALESKGCFCGAFSREKDASSPFGTISSILERLDPSPQLIPSNRREQPTEVGRNRRMRGLSGRSGRHALSRSLERHMRWDT